ncbi:hypothetical protein BX666DRAFT_1959147 [Dichotomocladium elegans]|nr:hypothetical protein BX666DRAFT_1959147 [Dichotomocladium elegans]
MKNKELSSQPTSDSVLSESKSAARSRTRKWISQEITASGNNSTGSASNRTSTSTSTSMANHMFDLTDGDRKTYVRKPKRLKMHSSQEENPGIVLEDSDEEVKLVRGVFNRTSGRRGFCITSSPEEKKKQKATARSSSASSSHTDDNIIDKAIAVIGKSFPHENTLANGGFSLKTSNKAKTVPDLIGVPEEGSDNDEMRLSKRPKKSVREEKCTATAAAAATAAAFQEIDAFTNAILAEKSRATNVHEGRNQNGTPAAPQRTNMSLSKQRTQRLAKSASFSRPSSPPHSGITSSPVKTKPTQRPVPIAVPTRFSARLSSKAEKDEPICIDLDNEEPFQVEKYNEPVCSYPSEGAGGIRIFKSDIERLEGNEFLNDTLIEFYLRWLLDHSCNGHEIYVFNSFFYERLSNSTSNDPYEAVRRWAAKADIFEKRFIFIPVNESFHWFLIVVTNPGSCLHDVSGDDPRIFILDSLGIKRTRFGKTIQKYLKSAAKDRRNIDESDFRLPRIYHANVPIQGNAFDCGVYLLHFAQICMADPDRFEQLLLANHLDNSAWRANAVQGLRSTIAKTIHDIENKQ